MISPTPHTYNREQFRARLAHAIGTDGRSARQIAQDIGLNCCTLQRALSGRSGMQAQNVAALCRELHVSADWLLGLDDAAPVHHLLRRPVEDGWLP